MDASLRVEIFVADVARTVRFYERMGFEVTGSKDGTPRYAAMRFGSVRVGAAEARPVDRALRAVPTGTEIVVEVDDVRRLRDRMVDAGVDLDADLQQRPWGLEDFRLSDPDGYHYRFTSRR